MTYGQLLNRIGQAVSRYVANHPAAAGRDVQPGASLTFTVPTAAIGAVQVTIKVPVPLAPDVDSVIVSLAEPNQATVVVDPTP